MTHESVANTKHIPHWCRIILSSAEADPNVRLPDRSMHKHAIVSALGRGTEQLFVPNSDEFLSAFPYSHINSTVWRKLCALFLFIRGSSHHCQEMGALPKDLPRIWAELEPEVVGLLENVHKGMTPMRSMQLYTYISSP